MHFNSLSFLKSMSDCSLSDNFGYNCSLSTWFSNGMVFKILPKFKSRQDGDVIQYRDFVILKNMKHDAYLSVSREPAYFTNSLSGSSANPFLAEYSSFDERFDYSRVYLSQDNKYSFKIILFRNKNTNNTRNLMGGDVVKITHTEMSSDLTASIMHGDLGKEVYLRKYIGEFPQERFLISSYWTMEHEQFESAGEAFAINDYDLETTSKASVRFRHFTSGRLIKSLAIGSQRNSLFLQESSHSQKDYINFDLELVIKSSQ